VLTLLALSEADARALLGPRAGGMPGLLRLQAEGSVTVQPDAQQLRGLIAELRSLADDFELGILDRSKPDGKRWSLTAEQLMGRAKAAARAEKSGGGGTPSYGADGSRNGPTPAQAMTVSEERKAWDEWLMDVQVAMTYLRRAIVVLDKATPAQQHPDRPEFGCRVCSRPGKPELIYRAERCQWCYRFWLDWKVDVPEPILKLRREGKPVTENAIRLVLDELLAG
jgi:hypothetical protein